MGIELYTTLTFFYFPGIDTFVCKICLLHEDDAGNRVAKFDLLVKDYSKKTGCVELYKGTQLLLRIRVDELEDLDKLPRPERTFFKMLRETLSAATFQVSSLFYEGTVERYVQSDVSEAIEDALKLFEN